MSLPKLPHDMQTKLRGFNITSSKTTCKILNIFHTPLKKKRAHGQHKTLISCFEDNIKQDVVTVSSTCQLHVNSCLPI